jgi:hypothetical protein
MNGKKWEKTALKDYLRINDQIFMQMRLIYHCGIFNKN